VNYGCGYYGNGYVGGRWDGPHFRYNTYVTRVNITIVRNVYVDRTVYVNNSRTRIGFNGGRGGVQASPNAQQLIVARARHLGRPSCSSSTSKRPDRIAGCSRASTIIIRRS